MSKGKIAAQVSHVAMQLADTDDAYALGRAVILKAHEGIIQLLSEQPNVKCIRDAGLTEVPKGSLTCVGFIQKPKFEIITKNLQLV